MLFMSTKSYAQVLFMSTGCCLWAQDAVYEHRWAQDDAHRCCL